MEFDKLVDKLYYLFQAANQENIKNRRTNPLVLETISEIERISLPIISIVPADFLKGMSTNKKKDYGLDDYLQSDKVKIDTKIIKDPICPETKNGFEYVFFDREPRMQGMYTQIYVNDDLVGIVKNIGNPIMLSLVTIKNSIGAFPLVRGGLYSLNENNTIEFQQSKKFFHKKYFDTLYVNPLMMLYRTNEARQKKDDIIQLKYSKIA